MTQKVIKVKDEWTFPSGEAAALRKCVADYHRGETANDMFKEYHISKGRFSDSRWPRNDREASVFQHLKHAPVGWGLHVDRQFSLNPIHVSLSLMVLGSMKDTFQNRNARQLKLVVTFYHLSFVLQHLFQFVAADDILTLQNIRRQ